MEDQNKEKNETGETGPSAVNPPISPTVPPASIPQGGAPSPTPTPAVPTPLPQSPQPAMPPAPAQGDAESSVRSLRTFRGDVEDIVRDQRTSVISIAAAESERRSQVRGMALTEPRQRSWRGMLIGISVGLLLLGVASLAVALLPKSPDSVIEDLDVPSFFFVEDQKTGDVGTRQEKVLLAALAEERASVALPLGSVRQLVLTTTASTTSVLPARDFLLRLGGHIPASLPRVSLPAFMLGTHVFDGNQPLLLFKVDPYEQAFAAMLEWEPYLLIDLAPFFPSDATTTVASFKDEILDNKNVRVARAASGKAIALYSFLDRGTLLITTNEHTLREVLGRLTRPRI